MSEILGADNTGETLNEDISLSFAEREQAEADVAFEELLRGEPPIVSGMEKVDPDIAAIRGDASLGYDAWKFIAQLPVRSGVGGARDAFQEMMNGMNDLFEWQVEFSQRHPVVGAIFMDRARSEAVIREDLGLPKPEAPQLPEVPLPETAAGEMARGISQFMAGFFTPYKTLAGANTVTRMAIAGAISDGTAFDPLQNRVANMIRDFTGLRDPITEFLAAKPGDSKAEGRFKNVIEGLGLGVLADGFMIALRALRGIRRLRKIETPPEQGLTPGTLKEDAFSPLGNPKGPLTTGVAVDDALRKKMQSAAVETADVPPGTLLELDEGRGIFINFARITEPDDVKTVIQQAADLQSFSIKEAQRGVQSHVETQRLADLLGLTPEQVIRRNQGVPFNAETAVAARKLLNASAEKLLVLAEAAADPNAGVVDLYNFRRMMTVHHAIQKEVIGARTETARALNSWRIPVGGGQEQARAIEAMMDAHGGDLLSQVFARKIMAAKKAGALTNEQLNTIARKAGGSRTSAALQEAWIMGLLSGPKTHMVNMMSNTAVMFQALSERAVAARVGAAMGTQDGVIVGEATQMVFGMLEGFKDLWRYSASNNRMVRKGLKIAGKDLPPEGVTLAPGLERSKIDLPFREAISSESFGIQPDTLLAKTVNGFGAMVRLPGQALQAEDMVFKTLGYRMQLHALALRQATSEGLTEGALKERMWEIVQNPPENIRMDAVDNALYQTFTAKLGPAGSSLQRMVNKMPALRIILPFIRTPANILKYTFSRTPLAPLMGEFRADVLAGGARRDLALTRMAMGTAVMLTVADATMSGMISGGGPPDKASRDAMTRQGWQPYSILINGRWFSYNRLDPIGSMMGMAADIAEYTQWAARESEDTIGFEEVWMAGTISIASNVTNKTYLRGTSDLFEMLGDPKRFGPRYIQRLSGSIVPAGVAEITRGLDPYRIETNSMLDGLKARTPGWSKSLPAIRDLWGEAITYRSGNGWFYDAISPIYSKRENPTPIDTEILRLRMPLQRPSKKTSIEGVPIDLSHFPHAYDAYVRLAGNELKHPLFGLGAKDFLNQLVGGKRPESVAYKLATGGRDGGKATMIRAIVNDYRGLARQQIQDEFPEIDLLVKNRQRARIQQAMEGGG